MRRKGFTLIELLVVIAIIALLVSILMPSLGRARELAKQAACQANLNSVGKAIALYTTSANDQFPVFTNAGDANETVATTGSIGELFNGDLEEHGMNNVWLLIDEGMVSQAAFRCASDGDWLERTGNDAAGWSDGRNFSYTISWPYAKDASDNPNAAPLTNQNLDGGFAMMADRMPLDSDGNPANVGGNVDPSNHFKDGEAVLYKNYSVQFYKNTDNSNAGIQNDAIYTNETSGTVGGLPETEDDTSMVTPSR